MNISEVLYAWGAWRNREFRIRTKNTVFGASELVSYWQRCIHCLGTGKIKRKRCDICHGRKGKKVQGVRVDPRAIRQTGSGGMYVAEDPPADFLAIDDALRSLGDEATAVIESRYVKYPKKYARKGLLEQTGGEAARLTWVNKRLKKKMSAQRYRRVLTSCKKRLADILGVSYK